MFFCMIVKLVELVDRIEMRKTDCLERQDLSCTYLAHHELEGVVIIISIFFYSYEYRLAGRHAQGCKNAIMIWC